MHALAVLATAGLVAAQSVTVALTEGASTTFVLPAWPAASGAGTTISASIGIPGGGGASGSVVVSPFTTVTASAGGSSTTTETILSGTETLTATVSTLTTLGYTASGPATVPNATASYPPTVTTAGAPHLGPSAVGLLGFCVMGLIML